MSRTDIGRDLVAGLVVFLVALPLCLGVALASNAPPFAGVLAGVVGGILVGLLSGSHTSVSGPAAGLTAVVAAQIAALGSFQTFTLAVAVAGVFQVGLGLVRAGALAGFFPSSVIKGLLAAIGVILILKQLPHLFGRDTDPEGDMAFLQPDAENTFSELVHAFDTVGEPGAAAVGLVSLALLFGWDWVKALKTSVVPAPLVVVLLGVALAELLRAAGGRWVIEPTHLVQVPLAGTPAEFFGLLQLPDFGQWLNPKVYAAAATIAAVASLETLLNLEAVDRLDPKQRVSPSNRELLAQGAGNVVCGCVGGLPVTSVIVRSSVNINAGGRSRLSAVWHGVLLLGCVALVPAALNRIPLACLAAILLHTGLKLASPKLVRQMWAGGRSQFLPFAVTVAAIVFTDLLVGVLIGLGVALAFILRSNMNRPVRRVVEKHLGGDVVRVELANQVSFLNRAALDRVLNDLTAGQQVLFDARGTDYIDPDVHDLIRDFTDRIGPARGVRVSLLGFRQRYQLADDIQYVDHSTRDLQEKITPAEVMDVLKAGHERFRTGHRLTRDLGRQVTATGDGQHPLAVVVGCIDSRAPAELLFDLGVGDVFVVRVAGNVVGPKVLASVEYATAAAGAKLVLVLGHTRCGAVTAAVEVAAGVGTVEATGCQHIGAIVDRLRPSIDLEAVTGLGDMTAVEREAVVNAVAVRNVGQMVRLVCEESRTMADLVAAGRVLVVGAVYDVTTGRIAFLSEG